MNEDNSNSAGGATDTVENAAEAFLRLLADRGVDYFFGNAGTDFPSIIEAFAQLAQRGDAAPIPVLVPHENLAVSIAHGYYLATGRPQAVMLHVNVGTANALAALLNAARDNIPLLLAAGRTPVTEYGEFGSRTVPIHWAQEMFDQAGMLREIVKWEYELRTARQIEAVVDRALSIAMSAPRGPVYLSLPREILAQGKIPFPLAPACQHSPAAMSAPDAAAIAQAAAWLASAENPLIVTAGFGQQSDSVSVLSSLAARHALPVVGYRPRYVFLPSGHPMHMGYDPGPFLEAADVIVVLDCDVPWLPQLHHVNPRAKVIHIGADPLFVRYPMRSFRCDLAIAASSVSTLEALDIAIGQSDAGDETIISLRRERLAGWRSRAVAAREVRCTASFGTLTTAALADVVNQMKDPLDIVVNETASLPIDRLEFSEPGTYFGNSSAAGLGWGLGAALGLKLGARERRVICLVGDGSYMFGNPTPAHFVSAAMGLPTLTIIVNNRMWGAVQLATLSLYPDGVAARMARPPLTWLEPSPDYERVVEASGGYGEKVERADDLPGAIQRALHAVDVEKRQAVLNVRVSSPGRGAPPVQRQSDP